MAVLTRIFLCARCASLPTTFMPVPGMPTSKTRAFRLDELHVDPRLDRLVPETTGQRLED
jgi:hypothetical protein